MTPGLAEPQGARVRYSRSTIAHHFARWRRSRAGHAFAVALVLSCAIAALLYWRHSAELFTDYVKERFSPELALWLGVSKALNGEAAFTTALAWFLGQALLALLFVLELGGFYGFFANSAFGRLLIDFSWPGFPDILDDALHAPPPGYSGPPRLGGEFLERGDELSALLRFAGDEPKNGAAWMQINGAEGIGKSRLALEALCKLRERGWDVGLLKTGVTKLDIERSRLRGKTAILIEAPSHNGNSWEILSALMARQGERLRVLIEDQANQVAPASLPPLDGQRIAESDKGAPRLARLSDKAIKTLAPALSARAVAATEGRPLFALLGEDPKAEIARRVAMRLEIDAPKAAAALALAALAGPILFADVAQELQGRLEAALPDVNLRSRLFDGADKKTLRASLPALRPDVFANETFYQAIDKLDAIAREALIDLALSLNGEAVESRLASLWRGGGAIDERAELRDYVTENFEARRPALVERRRLEAEACYNATVESPALGANGVPDLAPLDAALTRLADIADARPYDAEVRGLEAKGAVNAIDYYGSAQCFADLERWGARLVALAADPRLADDREIRENEASCSINAINYYGAAQRFADLERWGARLIALADDPRFADDREIRVTEAKGAVNAIGRYGAAQRFADLERWGARLIALADDPRFADDDEIRTEEAAGAVDAINEYGAAQRFADLERWGARLVALAEDPRFADDCEIRRREAIGVVNAIFHYAKAHRFADLERWGARLIALADDPRFANDREIRVNEAKGAVNGIGRYGQGNRVKKFSTNRRSAESLQIH